MRVRHMGSRLIGHVQHQDGDVYVVWCNATGRHERWWWYACVELAE